MNVITKYNCCFRIMCIGPLFTVIPIRYHRYLSKDILKSYIACDDKYRDQLQKQMCPADIPVIVREYTIAVYPKVLDNLNAIGKAALEDLHPWILCTLIDWERFDRVICDMPGSTCEGKLAIQFRNLFILLRSYYIKG